MLTFPVVMEAAQIIGKVTVAVAPAASESITCAFSLPLTVICSSVGSTTATLLHAVWPLFLMVMARSKVLPSRRSCLLTE